MTDNRSPNRRGVELDLDIEVEFPEPVARRAAGSGRRTGGTRRADRSDPRGQRGRRRRSQGSRRRTDERSAPAGRDEAVIGLQPVRTEDGYRSVYAELTRLTFGRAVVATVRVFGEMCITSGLIVLLFAAFEVWGVSNRIGDHQNDLGRQLEQSWAGEPDPNPSVSKPPPAEGEAIARLYVPRMKTSRNKAWNWAVVQGVSAKSLAGAPGHDPATAMPGELGNFVVAGHRALKIFYDLDLVKPGDPIVVRTQDSWFVYSATQSYMVKPTQVAIANPVPNQPAMLQPTKAMLTIYTCNKWSNTSRLVLHAELVRTQPSSAGDPTELGS